MEYKEKITENSTYSLSHKLISQAPIHKTKPTLRDFALQISMCRSSLLKAELVDFNNYPIGTPVKMQLVDYSIKIYVREKIGKDGIASICNIN